MPRVSKTLTSTQIKNIKNQTVAVGGISGLYFRNNPRQSFFFYRFKDENGKTQLAHTLNNTCVAPPRMLIAFLENHLQADGTVTIPEVLRPYMGGKAVLVPNKK